MIGSGAEEWDTEQAVCDEIRGKMVQMCSLETVYKIVEILVSGGAPGGHVVHKFSLKRVHHEQ